MRTGLRILTAWLRGQPTDEWLHARYVDCTINVCRDIEITWDEALEAFDNWFTGVERAAAEKALADAADERERLHGLPNKTSGWLRARAEAYRQERKEQ